MRHRITKPSLLVVTLLVAQLVMLLGGVFWFGQWIEGRLASMVRERILEANRQFAVQISRLIEQMELDGVRVGSPGWERLQRLVEQTTLPNGGFLCVIDEASTRVLCHPGLAQDPELANRALGDLIVRHDGRRTTLRELGAAGTAVDAGWIRLDDGTELLTVRRIPSLGVQLLVHQPEAGMRAAVGQYAFWVRAVGAVVTVVLVAFTAAISYGIIRQYNNRLATINAELERKVEQRTRSLVQSREAVIFGLAMLAESRDGETGEHLDRIRRYVRLLGREVARRDPSLDGEWLNTLVTTSALHDIGKVGVPDAVLHKPDKLTEQERRIIEKHPFIGGDTLLELKRRWGEEDLFLVTASQICLGHHERWDGTGYPFGLAGENIPLPARIVALADVYDALTSQRRYKDAMTHERVRQMIVEASGTQFDPAVVEAFLAVEDEFRRVATDADNGKSWLPPREQPTTVAME